MDSDPRETARIGAPRGIALLPFSILTVAVQPSNEPAEREAERSSGSTDSSGTPRPRRSSSLMLVVGVVVVVVVMVVAYMLFAGMHSSGSSSGSKGYVLVPNGTGYSLPVGQFNGINFQVSTPSTIQGQINASRGVQVYLMTPSEYQVLVRTGNISGYNWTSGVVAYETTYTLTVPVPVGTWVLAFVDPNSVLPTGVGFYSDLTLQSG